VAKIFGNIDHLGLLLKTKIITFFVQNSAPPTHYESGSISQIILSARSGSHVKGRINFMGGSRLYGNGYNNKDRASLQQAAQLLN